MTPVYGRDLKVAILGARPVSFSDERLWFVLKFLSFTFGDFPRSALLTGGAILKQVGLSGTYYASFGLMGKQDPTGTIFLPQDLQVLFAQGHELGCHTFDHYDSSAAQPRLFEDSVLVRLNFSGILSNMPSDRGRVGKF